MNCFTYENQGTNTYLVYEIREDEIIDSMSLGMLTNNKIVGFAPTLFIQMDDTKYIKYNVSAKISVRQFFSGAVNKKRIIGVFIGIVNGLLSAEDYMIDSNTILLDLDYIYADVSTCEAALICLPICSMKMESNDLGTFFKNIMFTAQFDQTENCDYVTRIISFLNGSPAFSLADFKRVLDGINSESSKETPISTQPTINNTQPVVQSKVIPAFQTQPKGTIFEQPSFAASVGGVTPIQPTQPSKQPAVQIPAQPVQLAQPVVPQPTQSSAGISEKKISMLGLLMHYSKENKELYQRQKAASKKKKASDSIQKSAVPAKKTAANQDFVIPKQSMPAKQPVVQPIYHSPIQQGQSVNFGETTVLGRSNIGETTVLNAGMQQTQTVVPHLIRMKNQERIIINKPVFRIGIEKSYADYFIDDNTAISRSHANISSHNGEYFVSDTNSTNHTFVNGIMIRSNVETKIVHGDIIRFADEDFEFKLY